MPDQIGRIDVPEIAPSGVFPFTPDYPFVTVLEPEVYIHRFGSRDAKTEQRFYAGPRARTFLVHLRSLAPARRRLLEDFWLTNQGGYGAFTFHAPNPDGTTTPCTCRFAEPTITFEYVAAAITSVESLALKEMPGEAPTYEINSTVTRFPTASLATALLEQAQEITPLVHIRPLEADYPEIYVSDRRVEIGGQLYQARLIDFDGIQQTLGGSSDDATFQFGNADRVMTALVNDTDLTRAAVEFSLFHVSSGIKIDLWAGNVVRWQFDRGPIFTVTAADGIYELNLPYPTRKCSRTCQKPYNSQVQCPWTICAR